MDYLDRQQLTLSVRYAKTKAMYPISELSLTCFLWCSREFIVSSSFIYRGLASRLQKQLLPQETFNRYPPHTCCIVHLTITMTDVLFHLKLYKSQVSLYLFYLLKKTFFIQICIENKLRNMF